MWIYHLIEYLRALQYVVTGFVLLLVGTHAALYLKAKTEEMKKGNKDDSKEDS